ncbi:MAG: prepilin-type N-terminal cleavage/methylation domain-containing protein [Butyrivibrio sp.]|nr:prepilin-type N-terminal cleavage/methylation domain-containing protein [Butyrivibrio sp.]MCM1263915.1 prepilin-type N-terminal cleavage/methylation domain-containing protein [Butyrivibrio sp.]
MNNQKGFTIVELLIGMVILSIVTAALTGFIVSSSKSYAASNTEIVVQQESQLAMNQISDVIIDTTRSVNYVGYTADGDTEQVLKDADFTKDIEDKCLTLYNGERKVKIDEDGNQVKDGEGNLVFETATDAGGNPLGNGNKNYQIYYDKDEERLYFSEAEIDSLSFPESDRVVLAEFVKEFNVDLSQVEEKRVVSISIKYEYNNRLYETSNNITIRNKVLVNELDLEIDRSVELRIRIKDPLVTLEPNEDYRFSTPVFEGKNILDKSVTWTIVPDTDNSAYNPTAADTGFTDDKNGVIHISSAEMAAQFTVRVTSNAVDSNGTHATAEAVVQVKRAKDINLAKTENDSSSENGPLEISAGSDITITATLIGTGLGITCDKCGDPVTIDKYVVKDENGLYAWKIIKGDNICTMTSSDHGKAQFTIDASAQPGQEVTIQATSLLSITGNDYNRLYAAPGALSTRAPVTKSITLKVKDSERGKLSDGGEIRYGRKTTLNIINASDFNSGAQGYFMTVARIKEDPNAPMEDDMVICFNTHGLSVAFTPDFFGLKDIGKDYYISIQVLDPKKHIDDSVVAEVKAEYENNLNSKGEYIGTKYPSTEQKSFLLRSPQLGYKYKGEECDVGTPLIIDTIYAANGGATVSCPLVNISNARDEVLNQYVFYKVYRGEGDDPKNWEFIYGRDEKDGNYKGNERYGNLNFASIKNIKDLQVNLDGNNNPMSAAGTYHYVPYIEYANDPDADSSYKEIYWKNYEPEYGVKKCYTRENSTVHFTIEGGNMGVGTEAADAFIAADQNNTFGGETYFPLPSDTSGNGFTKYFNLKDSSLQHAKEKPTLKVYEKGANSAKYVTVSDMTCQWYGTKGDDYYVIEIFYTFKDSFWGNIELSAGKYKCDAGGTKWTKIGIGDIDEYYAANGSTSVSSVKTTGNAQIKIKGAVVPVQAYIPLPTQDAFTQTYNGAFGFNLDNIKSGAPQTVTPNMSIAYKGNDPNQAKWIQCNKATCSYDAARKVYTLTVYCGDEETILTLTEGARNWSLKP